MGGHLGWAGEQHVGADLAETVRPGHTAARKASRSDIAALRAGRGRTPDPPFPKDRDHRLTIGHKQPTRAAGPRPNGGLRRRATAGQSPAARSVTQNSTRNDKTIDLFLSHLYFSDRFTAPSSTGRTSSASGPALSPSGLLSLLSAFSPSARPRWRVDEHKPPAGLPAVAPTLPRHDLRSWPTALTAHMSRSTTPGRPDHSTSRPVTSGTRSTPGA